MATSPFLDNFFCLIPRTDLAFVVISKNAVTFLKRVALLHGTGEWCTDQGLTHKFIGTTASSPYLVPIRDMPAWEAKNGKRTKFAVWRDPIERIESGISLFCYDKMYVPHLRRMGLYQNPTPEHYRRIMDFEMTKSGAWIEQHFRPQSQTYQRSDVDTIIGMSDVRDFLMSHHVDFVDERSNASHYRYTISDPEFRQHIRDLYRGDYLLQPEVRHITH